MDQFQEALERVQTEASVPPEQKNIGVSLTDIKFPARAGIGVPKLYWGASVDDFSESVLRHIPSDPTNIFITGDNGVGKTHLSVCILMKWWDKIEDSMKLRFHEGETRMVPDGMKSSVWTTIPEVLFGLRDSFNKDSERTEASVIDQYAYPHTAVFDDFGAEKFSDFSLSSLYLILSRRINNMRPTIVTTNLGLKDIDEIDPRIASRLAGFTQIKLEGRDRRIKA